MEREISQTVLECTPDGRLSRAAIGWSRRPLHRCNLAGHWGRKKRWDYWCVTSDTHLISFTCADCDYLGLASVLFLDYASKRPIEKGILVPLARGFRQPETVGGSDILLEGQGLRLEMREESGGTRLRAKFRKLGGPSLRADILAARPPAHETLNVVVPFGGERFQFTSKQNTRPATGSVEIDGRAYAFGPSNQAFACLDFGRGIWPYRTAWNWASASGVQEGRTVGLQFGGKWTDGTGTTENGICVDGRLTKIGEEVEFRYDRRDFMKPWRLASRDSERVALTFVPFFEKRMKVNLLLLRAELHLCFGHFEGTVVDETETRIPVRRLLGWSEEMHARW